VDDVTQYQRLVPIQIKTLYTCEACVDEVDVPELVRCDPPRTRPYALIAGIGVTESKTETKTCLGAC
jgi:hypothetical protein